MRVLPRIKPLSALLALGIACSAAAATKRPNIVFILADDLGYTDLACYGSKYYETPNIDRLRTHGISLYHGQTPGASLPTAPPRLYERLIHAPHGRLCCRRR